MDLHHHLLPWTTALLKLRNHNSRLLFETHRLNKHLGSVIGKKSQTQLLPKGGILWTQPILYGGCGCWNRTNIFRLFAQIFVKSDSIFSLKIMELSVTICTQNNALSDFFFYVGHIVAICYISCNSTFLCARIYVMEVQHIVPVIAAFCASNLRLHFVYFVFSLCVYV